MKKSKIVLIIALLAVVVTAFACCGKSQPLNLSAEAKAAYIEKVKAAQDEDNPDHLHCALADVNGDGKAELLLEVWGSGVSVSVYDETSGELVILHAESVGKGYSMQGYYDTEKCQVIFPNASTKGGMEYDVYEFSGEDATLVKQLKRYTELIGKERVLCYKIDGVVCTEEEFTAAEESLADGFTGIDLTAEEAIALLSE